MNQFYRALHMPPKRLLRKVMGEKEVYTIAVRPRPTAEGTEPLPALGAGPYTMLPGREGWWFADPLLCHRGGKRWLFAEAMDPSTGKGRLEVCELHDDGSIDGWRVALEEDFHLSFPMVFDWNGEVWMIPETGHDHSLRLYRCRVFPTKWELVQRFATDEELCDAILVDRRAEALTILCSETKPDNQLYVRYRRYTLCHAVQETAALPLAEADTLPAAAPDWYAVIIGQGAQSDELARRLTEAGLMGRCRLIPQLPNAQVHIYYHACNAFVNLNENEIFGMSLLEAMYAGCPPVARHAPGPDLIIENGISGYLCDTVAEMAAALDKTTDAMGHAAQNRVNEHFLWQNSAELALTLLPKKGKTNG